MKRDLAQLKNALAILEKQLDERKPLVKYDAPADDAEAVELFAKARDGDEDAQDRLYCGQRLTLTGAVSGGARSGAFAEV